MRTTLPAAFLLSLLTLAGAVPVSAADVGLVRLFTGLQSAREDFEHEIRYAQRCEGLVEEELTLPAAPRLFFGHASSSAEAAAFEVIISPASGSGAPRRAAFRALAREWSDDSLDLADFAGQKVRIAFEAPAGSPLLLSSPFVASGASRKPNLILIGIDTLAAGHLGAYGYGRPTSPFLDRWAKEGVLFESAYSQVSWTLPSFVSIFTGLYPDTHGVVRQTFKMTDEHRTIQRTLRQNGYYTVGVHGGGYVSDAFGLGLGFDVYRKAEGFGNFLHSRTMAEWLKTHREVPFFMFLHTFAVHGPYGRGEPYDNLFTDPAYADTQNLKQWVPHGGRESFAGFKPRDARYLAALYDGAIRSMDEQLEKIIAVLKESGRYEDTYIVFTSDHGEEFGEHGSFDHGWGLHEEVLHVPMIVRGPGVVKGRRVRDLVETVDLAPTVEELLGLPREGGTDGKSLAGFLHGKGRAGRKKDHALGQLELPEQGKKVVALRTDRWSWMRLADGTERVYERRMDRKETRDLSASHGSVARQLGLRHAQLSAESHERTRAPETAAAVVDDDTLKKLRSLGYLN